MASGRRIDRPSRATERRRSSSLGRRSVTPGAVSRDRRCLLIDRHAEVVPYAVGWELQKALVEERIQAAEKGTRLPDAAILLQHDPVYTLGTGSTEENLLFEIGKPPHPVFRTERGGEVTYHGPGQLVLYPILDLRHNHNMDLHWYLRKLEETVISTLGKFGLQGERIEGLTGVWVDGQKVAAEGIRVRRWITYHGVAINVTNDMLPFSNIIPCGIQDRSVTSIKELLGSKTLGEHAPQTGDESLYMSRDEGLLELVRGALVSSFAEVFDMEIEVCTNMN